MIRDQISESFDRVVRARRHMTECSPVIRHEMASSQSSEQLERVLTREMPFSETLHLPPRRISDRQQSDIELPAAHPEYALDKKVCRFAQSRVSRKETALIG